MRFAKVCRLIVVHRLSQLVVLGALIGALITPSPAIAAPAAKATHANLAPPSVMDIAAAQAAAHVAPIARATAAPGVPRNLVAAANTPLQREVFGFVNASNLGSASVGYQSWNLSLLTTVAFFGLPVQPGDGSIDTNSTGWQVAYSQTMTKFVNAAHAKGVRVIIAFNARGNICGQLSAASAQNTVKIAKQEMLDHNADGVNIDYEGYDITCPDGNRARDDLTAFVQNMRAALPNYYISIDTYSGSAEDNLEVFNVTGIAPYVDSFFVMAYDMDKANWFEAPLNCPSYCFNPVSPLNTYRWNVTKSMTQYKALVPGSKIILGQPYYGRRGCVANLTDAHQLETRDEATPTYIFASTLPSQGGVFNFASHRDPSDGVSEWDTWYDSDWTCNREQYWDDVRSLGAKYDLVNQADLRGVGFFTLDYGGGAPELWNEIAAKFTTTTLWSSLGGVLVSGPGVSSWGSTRSDVFAQGGERGLWQNTYNGTTWGGWTPLGGVITGDPDAASWGTGRIDVFVRGQDNALWHRYSDGTSWSGWEALGGGLNFGPAVASWGTNRLDIFVTGQDSSLWHRCWCGTGWGGWEHLGGVLSSKSTVVSWAGGRLDIFARGQDNQMWHKYWSNGWGPWEPLGGQFISGPGSASCTSGHLDVYAIGFDHGLWRKSWTGNQWTGWSPQGGRWLSDPGAACVAGTTNESVFEVGIDSAVWQTTVSAA